MAISMTQRAHETFGSLLQRPFIGGAAVIISMMLGGIVAVLAGSVEERHSASDILFDIVASNVETAADLEIITDVDHARLAAGVGEEMPPSHVLIFSDAGLEADLMKLDPRIGLDLPMRILAYETSPGGPSRVIYNDVSYLEDRYRLTLPPEVRSQHADTIGRALARIPADSIAKFDRNLVDVDGLVALNSSHDFEETLRRLRAAIDSQDDTVWFGEVDLAGRSRAEGVHVPPARLLLFGAPGPGGKAMANAPSLGLDAFCQKVLVLQDEDGEVSVLFNDLLALADRHGVPKNIPLRLINWRISRTFQAALEP